MRHDAIVKIAVFLLGVFAVAIFSSIYCLQQNFTYLSMNTWQTYSNKRMHSAEKVSWPSNTIFGILATLVQFGLISSTPQLIDIHTSLVRDIENYILSEKVRLMRIQHVLDTEFKFESMEKEKHLWKDEDIVENPLKTFVLVQRFTYGLKKIFNYTEMAERHQLKLISNLDEKQSHLPGNFEFATIIESIFRLQDTYNLKIKDLASGILKDYSSGFKLAAKDCLELGRQRLASLKYNEAVEWLQLGLRKLATERKSSNYNATKDLDHNLRNKVINKIHENTRLEFTDLLGSAQEMAAGLDFMKSMDIDIEDFQNSLFLPETARFYQNLMKQFAKTCRKHKHSVNSRNPELKCFFQKSKSTLLAPIKAEKVFANPSIFVFHGILHELEIKILQTLATPTLARARVIDEKSGSDSPSRQRTSDSSWLSNYVHPLMPKLNARIEAITGLSMKTAEDLQVAHYTPGGLYEPHFDFKDEGEMANFYSPEVGNRVATFMFYLSDVQAGGATVFTSLGLAVYPEKGSALFWYNIKDDGKVDHRTRHGACPVLVGTKWVANKWIHERDQEFRRPCRVEKTKK